MGYFPGDICFFLASIFEVWLSTHLSSDKANGTQQLLTWTGVGVCVAGTGS